MKLPRLFHFLFIAVTLIFQNSFADEVTLEDHGFLTGTIKSSPNEGTFFILTQISSQPLQIKTDAIAQVVFTRKDPQNHAPNMIVFKNGDQLPGKVLGYKNLQLQFSSTWQSDHSIDKNHLDSIVLTQSNDQTIYSGPNQSDWKKTSNAHAEDGTIRFNGSGSAHWKAPELPVRHTIVWEITWNDSVGLEIIMASARSSPNKDDCYRFTFDGSGLQLVRHSPSAQSPDVLASAPELRVFDMKEKRLRVELAVDRDNRILKLTANGKILRNNIIDPETTGAIPKGKHYTVICSGRTGSDCHLRTFQILEKKEFLSSAQEEKRILSNKDSFYDMDCNYVSGELIAIQTGKKNYITFSNPHSPQNIEPPIEKVAKIFFSGEPTEAIGKFVIRTTDFGSIHANSFQFHDNKLRVEHEFLGELLIPLPLIQDITRS